jgi:hypothetical protein
MKRILSFLVVPVLLSATLTAAQNSETFYLVTSARAGNVELPRGIYEAIWDAPSKSRVTLTMKTDNEKTFKVQAYVVAGKQSKTGVVTSVVGGVTYLQELRTNNAKFIFRNRTETPK